MRRITIALAVLVSGAFLLAAQANATCGSNGGPGYRKANGKCASWRD